MIIGYIRVSKHEQNFDLQVDSLKKAGCEKIFSEKISVHPRIEKSLIICSNY